MAEVRRLSDLLNYEIRIDLEKQVSRITASAVLIICAVILVAVGFFIGDRWFWTNYPGYFEYQREVLRESLAENPKRTQVKTELAMADYLDGDEKGAIKALRDILRREPGNQPAVLYLGLILSEQKKYQESTDLLSRYAGQNEGFETRLAYLYLGRNFLATGNYEMAKKHLKTAAERDPGNPLTYYWLGQTYERMNDLENAIASYEKTLEISSGFFEAERALNSLVSK